MTLPNKLTLARILAIPAIVIIAIIPYLNRHFVLGVSISNFINLIIFALACATDFLDGYLARKNNTVTTFGKFADPLADKMIVLSAFIILVVQNPTCRLFDTNIQILPVWGVIVILIRELMVSGIRLVEAERGVVIAAGWAGKVKTFVTMFAIIFTFLHGVNLVFDIIALVLMYAAIILTIYSGVEYLWKSRKVIFESI